ncbi:MAG TPA: sulfotransferase [Rhizomicrobium sp.]|jgi:hypothetical protein
MKQRYPDFVGIGAQKAGTTWLHNNLGRVPQIWLPATKELHYFDSLYVKGGKNRADTNRREKAAKQLKNIREGAERTLVDKRRIELLRELRCDELTDQWYGRVFSYAPAEKLCGEITPGYSVLKRVGIEHLFRLSPNAKIILMMRDPIDRSWSQIRMSVRKGSHDLERLAKHHTIVSRSDYPSMLSAWGGVFARNHIHTIFTDHIGNASDKILSDVCEFLGVKFVQARVPKSEAIAHEGQPMDMPASVYNILKDRLRPIYDRLDEIDPDMAAQWRARHY